MKGKLVSPLFTTSYAAFQTKEVFTYYLHLDPDQVFVFQEDQVDVNQLIAKLYKSTDYRKNGRGRFAFPPHLHFEIWKTCEDNQIERNGYDRAGDQFQDGVDALLVDPASLSQLALLDLSNIEIDFETPQLGASNRQMIDPYVDLTTGFIFTAEPDICKAFGNQFSRSFLCPPFTPEPPPGIVPVIGVVKNNGAATDACVPPADANQKLGTGLSSDNIGFSGFPIKVTFPFPLTPPVTISCDIQASEEFSLVTEIFDSAGVPISGGTHGGLGGGICPGNTGVRRRIITMGGSSVTQPVAYAIIGGISRLVVVGNSGFPAPCLNDCVFVIDNFQVSSGP